MTIPLVIMMDMMMEMMQVGKCSRRVRRSRMHRRKTTEIRMMRKGKERGGGLGGKQVIENLLVVSFYIVLDKKYN